MCLPSSTTTHPWRRIALLLLAAGGLNGALFAGEPTTSYNYDVRPVLAAKCFACHGSDAAKRKGKLRLDERAAAIEKQAIVPGNPGASELIKRLLTSDPEEIMPPPEKHNPVSDSERELLIRWIKEGAKYEAHWAFIPPVQPTIPTVAGATDPIDALVRDAVIKKGWQPAPEASPAEWLRRVTLALTGLPPTLAEIGAFLRDVEAAPKPSEISPSSGGAATPSAPDAYEAVVDRLLKSPHYGEHMAIEWLDAARYGDTYGRHEDADNEVWPWRDWVIKAFNDNLPYDQFIQWQMAGDLLPEPTQDQIVATAFHRLAVQSNESGSDPEEFRWDQVFDRVKTTATAVMGLTLECARCHDHKYDPFSAREYFQFAAFLNNIDELGLFSRYTNGVPPPTAFIYKSGEQGKHTQLKHAVVQAEQNLLTARQAAPARFSSWLKTSAPPSGEVGLWSEISMPNARKAAAAREPELFASFDIVDLKKKTFRSDTDKELFASGTLSISEEAPGKFGRAAIFPDDKNKKYGFPRVAHYTRQQPFTFSFWFLCPQVQEKAVILHRSRAGLDAANRGYELTFEDGKLTATLAHFYPGNAIRVQAVDKIAFQDWTHIGFTYDGSSRAAGLKLYVNGRLLPVKIVRDHLYKDIDYLAEWGDLDNLKVADADLDAITLRFGGRTLDGGLRGAAIDEMRAYNAELSAPEVAQLAGVKASDDAAWLDWFMREVDEPCRTALVALQKARAAENEFSTHLTELMVMQEQPGPRRVTPFLTRGDFRQPGDPVEPGTPAALLAFPKDAPRNRLGLAQWLTQPEHPLTSRVQVNRLWAKLFGRGIVSTPEDFGLQGRVPSNPTLLDYLAVQFVRGGWDIKAICKQIVLSQTYRQSSLPSDPDISRADPDNLVLARGPRIRLGAEQLRDAALAASGLINAAVGGRSVMPYQPAGLWEDSGTQHVYTQDKGDKLYHRSLYTFWRRTCPPPVMSIFDAPTREFCRVRRETTLTPLQALALTNDIGFLEAARALAEKLVKLHPTPSTQAERVRHAFRLLTARLPSEAQTTSMSELINEARDYYTLQPAEAWKLLAATGDSSVDQSLSATEVASTLIMTRALFSSEPFVTSY